MAPRLSEGWPHSAASHVSLKSSQRTSAPMLNAPWTGSSWYFVPGTRTPRPFFSSASGTTGPSSFVHAGKFRASIMQERLSIRHKRAVSYASALSMRGVRT